MSLDVCFPKFTLYPVLVLSTKNISVFGPTIESGLFRKFSHSLYGSPSDSWTSMIMVLGSILSPSRTKLCVVVFTVTN